MKPLIVGASGHLGAHLARALLSRGINVRALVRPGSRRAGLAGIDVEIVTGDVLDRDSVREALRGCMCLYHLAAPTTAGEPVDRIIMEGTRIVIEESARSGIDRAVVTSSTVTVGYANDPSIVLDEGSFEQSSATGYHAAKWEAERFVIEFTRRSGLPIIIVNPSAVVGSLDYRVTPSTAPIQRCIDRGLPFAFPGGITIAHAADVAVGHVQAMEHGIPGERYILGGERLTIPNYFALISQICGRQPPRLVLPQWAMLGVGAGCMIARSLGIGSVPFSFRQIRNIVGRYAWYSSEKARSVLGYQSRPASEAIKAYADWVASGRPAGKTR